MDRLSRLNTCTDCSLYRSRNLICSGVGPVPAGIGFIGEAPGAEENECGVPFIGPAGQLLDGLLERTGLKRELVYISNSVMCFGGRDSTGKLNVPTKDQVGACCKHLQAELDLVQPKVLKIGRAHV